MKALWYDGDYYLFPPGCPDAAAFLKTADFAHPLTILKLAQEHAFAPCFDAAKTLATEVSIDPAGVYPCEVELLDADELRKRAAAAEKKCDGCRWKVGSADLGHETCPALSLLDSCPLREEGFDPGFLRYAAAYWRRIEGILPKLERLVARKRFAKAAKAVDRLRSGIPDVFVALAERDHRPVLMFSGAGNDFLHLVAQYLAYTAPKEVTSRFDVLSTFPKGVFTRLDPGKRDRMEKNPPRVVLEPVRTDRPRFDLSILVYAAAKDSAPDDAFLFLCERMGEHKLMGAMNSIRFIDDSGFDLDFHEKAVDLADPRTSVVSAAAYENIVDDAYAREKDLTGLASPFCFYEYFDVSGEEPVGELADTKIVDTCFMELDEDLLYDEDKILSDVFDAGVGIGRITIRATLDENGMRDLSGRVDQILNKHLHFAGGSVPFSIQLAERKTVFHFLIMDKRIVRNAVRALAPMLAAHGATYREIWPDGTLACAAGFALDLLDGPR